MPSYAGVHVHSLLFVMRNVRLQHMYFFEWPDRIFEVGLIPHQWLANLVGEESPHFCSVEEPVYWLTKYALQGN